MMHETFPVACIAAILLATMWMWLLRYGNHVQDEHRVVCLMVTSFRLQYSVASYLEEDVIKGWLLNVQLMEFFFIIRRKALKRVLFKAWQAILL